MKKTYFSLILLFLGLAVVNATTVNFTAQAGTGVANLSGTALTGTNVELGYYDGSFSSVGSVVALTGDSLPAGLFGANSLFNSDSLTALQPALRIFSDDGGSVIVFSTNWSFSAGDGTGTDSNTDGPFDLANVVSGGSLTGTGSIFASAASTFNLNGANNPTFGAPSLEIGLVPEPSAFALIAGCFGMAWVMVRRRATH
jgi:hypothetical protein